MNAPTIKDVANAAGVSVATISRVLSNPDLVKPATKEHVLRIIKEMNYQPNVLARQLRTQTTRAVIVIVPNIENSFFHGILSGIGTEAERQGYQMLIADDDQFVLDGLKEEIDWKKFNIWRRFCRK